MALAIQYDLFGEIEAAERSARTAGRVASLAARDFLTETPWPGLLGWWLHPEALESGDRQPNYRQGPDDTPGWAWATRRAGLRFESGQSWPGWGVIPRWQIAWSELHRVRKQRSDITERLEVLAEGRGHPCALGWRWWIDAHALRPDGMHPSYLEREREPDYYANCARPDTAYTDRLEAWQLVLGAMRAAELVVVDMNPERVGQ